MSTPTAVIAEDEPLLRGELRDLLASLWPELSISAEASDGTETLRALEEFAPQVLFLDIQMPGLNGLEVAQYASGKAHVVFITAHDQYAIAAFEHGALDYILKPISAARLAVAVDRVRERLRAAPADLQGIAELLRGVRPAEPEYLRWITVPHGHEMRFLTTDEVCYLRADDKYASVVTANAEFLLSSSLKQMKQKLDPRVFWQIHRGIIVNASAIHSVHRTFRGALEVRLKSRPEILPVSAAHASLFKHL
jgi:DNA-binding LytR/AlgR family response regulator